MNMLVTAAASIVALSFDLRCAPPPPPINQPGRLSQPRSPADQLSNSPQQKHRQRSNPHSV
jgi:hypothetical protein